MSRHSLRIGKQSWGVGGWAAFLAISLPLIFAGTCDVLRDKPQQAWVHPHICHIYEGHHFGGLAQTAAWPDWLAG